MSNYRKKLVKYQKKALKINKPFLQLPYSILRSDEFINLSSGATKIYMKLLSLWTTVEPDKAIPLSYRMMAKEMKCSNRVIVKALGELEKNGFVLVVKEYHRVNRYLIETKWFDGSYP